MTLFEMVEKLRINLYLPKELVWTSPNGGNNNMFVFLNIFNIIYLSSMLQFSNTEDEKTFHFFVKNIDDISEDEYNNILIKLKDFKTVKQHIRKAKIEKIKKII